MGDPFSVAGTAVGITSLGIQTFQILYNYYSHYKGFHDDIDTVLRQVEGLKGILESLRQVKERFEIDNHAPSSQLQLALEACEAALKQLKIMADKCNTTKQAGDIQTRFRNARKRLLWPYKKDTLSDMLAVLSRFQDNLSLALQSAGLDVVLQKLTNLRPVLNNLENQAANIELTLSRNTSELQAFHQDTATATLAHEQYHKDISSGLEQLHTQTLHQHAAVICKLDVLVGALAHSALYLSKLQLSGISSRHPATIPPFLLAESIETLGNSDLRSLETLQVYNTPLRQADMCQSVRGTYSTCHCRPKRKQSKTSRRWISIFAEEKYDHNPECPHFARADYARSIAAQFTIFNRLVGLCIQAGWQSSRSGGWTTIAPILRYRAVVSSDSGAFKILNDARKVIRKMQHHEVTQENLNNILSTTSFALQKSFRDNARPNDVDEFGNGIMHVCFLIHIKC
jgi:hypothetical protein